MTAVTLLNLGHPLTPDNLREVTDLTGCASPSVFAIVLHLADGAPLAAQVRRVLDAAPLTATQWQTAPLLVNLPGLAVAAAAVLADVHGRRGGFPKVLRWVRDSITDVYRVTEVLDLQASRERARAAR